MHLDHINSWLSQKFSDHKLSPLSSGANGTGYLVESHDKKYFLKHFSSDSTGEKIKREVAFTRFCLLARYYQVPQVEAFSAEHSLLLMDYIDSDSNIDTLAQFKFVKDAVEFVKIINSIAINELPLAADAAFELCEFKLLVSKRLSTLNTEKFGDENQEVKKIVDFVQSEYRALESQQANLAPLPRIEIASPSDFGIHNVLLKNEKLYFIDFEFAGVDSIWKLIADFFSQPQYPIEPKLITYFTDFIDKVQFYNNRKQILFVYHLTLLKWVLLMVQTGLRLFPNEPKKLKEHLVDVNQYIFNINAKLRSMETVLNNLD